MIYITGDTHKDVHFYKLVEFAKNNPQLTKDDYVIICGDFGGVFFEDTLEIDLKPYNDLPFTILFVDGNHENFDLLEKYEVSIWNGGKVHIIKDNIIHLMRGQIFEIQGFKIFTFGGATSIDKDRRILGYSYWKQELPTYLDLEEAYKNGNNLEAREKLLLASYKAGVAFTKSYVGNVHAIAHTLGGKYNVPHGLANAVILPYVLKAYGSKVYKKLWKLGVYAGIFESSVDIESGAKMFIEKIEQMNKNMEIGITIDKIEVEDIPTLAKTAEKEANPLYPVPVMWDVKQFEKIYFQVKNGKEK